MFLFLMRDNKLQPHRLHTNIHKTKNMTKLENIRKTSIITYFKSGALCFSAKSPKISLLWKDFVVELQSRFTTQKTKNKKKKKKRFVTEITGKIS